MGKIIETCSLRTTCSAQVYPSLESMKQRKLALDKPIILPVMRNVTQLKAGDELLVFLPKKDRPDDSEPQRDHPSKRIRRF